MNNFLFFIFYQLFFVIFGFLSWFLRGIFYRIPILQKTFLYKLTARFQLHLAYPKISRTIPKGAFTFQRYVNVLKNQVSNHLSYITKKPIVWSKPFIWGIELTNYCNLKCPVCPGLSGNPNIKKGYMGYVLFTKIIDQIEQYAYYVGLHFRGESFLHPDIYKMIAYVKSKKLYATLSTNANIPISADELVNTGLDAIEISFDGTNQETYSKYRVNGSLEKVLENIKNIVGAKKRLKKSNPKIINQFLIMEHNEQEIDIFLKMCKELEVDTYKLKPISLNNENDAEYLPNNSNYRMFQKTKEKITYKHEALNNCPFLWQGASISWDGELFVCCHDPENTIKIGNVTETSIANLWKAKPFTDFRQAVLLNRMQFDICRKCLNNKL
jgi:radical SAM protein with 4Fe4S-binding SPASM domain